MSRDDFPAGTKVRTYTRTEVPRRKMGTGTVVQPEPLPRDPLQATGMVLVALPAGEWGPAMNYWYEPERLEIAAP